MQLTREDAYAFRRVLSKLDVPEDVKLSPVAQLLFDSLDPENNEAGWQTLYNMVSKNHEIMQQVLYVDPLAPPPTDDHAYVDAYIQQATTQDNVQEPDIQRTNGSTELLMKLHQINQQSGPQAAQKLLQQQNSPLRRFDEVANEAPIEYLDEERIVQDKEITAVIGQPGAGKSFWTLRKLAELANTMPVLYIAAEGVNSERLQALTKMRQIEGMTRTEAFNRNFQIYKAPVDLTQDGGIETLLHHLGDFKPQVIAIDTFAACTPGIDENSSKDMQPILNRLREQLIARLNCAVLLIHHTTKDGKSFRGSSALRGNVANMYYLIQDDDLIILRSDKQRDSEPSPDRYYRLVKFETRLHPVTGEQLASAAMLPAEKVLDDPDKPKLQLKQKTILKMLISFENGLTTRSLQEATEIPKVTLWRNIQRLVKLGFIKTGEKGEPIFITDLGREILNQA